MKGMMGPCHSRRNPHRHLDERRLESQSESSETCYTVKKGKPDFWSSVSVEAREKRKGRRKLGAVPEVGCLH
jgi:hypothetical protein